MDYVTLSGQNARVRMHEDTFSPRIVRTNVGTETRLPIGEFVPP